MDTGIGVDAYSIMEQAKIDLILNNRPEERRFLFDEVAGITKYKRRKKAAIKKLEATEQNLVRINDIIHELQRETESLKRQAQEAESYQRWHEQLKTLELELKRREHGRFVKELTETQLSLDEILSLTAGANATIETTEGQIEEATEKRSELDASIRDAQEVVRQFMGEIEKTERQIALYKERQLNIQQQRQRAVQAIESLEKQHAELESQKDERNRERTQLDVALKLEESRLTARRRSSGISRASGRPVFAATNRREAVGVLGGHAQTDQSAPVLANQGRAAHVVRSKPSGEPFDLAVVAVVLALRRLVRAAEADQVRGEHAQTVRREHRDHLPVEIAPRRLPVHADHDGPAAWTGVDVVDAERAPLAVGNVGVMGFVGETRQVRKAFVGCAQELHGSTPRAKGGGDVGAALVAAWAGQAEASSWLTRALNCHSEGLVGAALVAARNRRISQTRRPTSTTPRPAPAITRCRFALVRS